MVDNIRVSSNPFEQLLFSDQGRRVFLLLTAIRFYAREMACRAPGVGDE